MSRTRHLVFGAVWLPLVAVPVLVGFAVGWWATGLGVVVLAIVALVAARAARDVRNCPSSKSDPAAVREELKALDRRAAPWVKMWTFGMLVVTALYVVVLLVIAFSMRS